MPVSHLTCAASCGALLNDVDVRYLIVTESVDWIEICRRLKELFPDQSVPTLFLAQHSTTTTSISQVPIAFAFFDCTLFLTELTFVCRCVLN